jgi:hypothetical protein
MLPPPTNGELKRSAAGTTATAPSVTAGALLTADETGAAPADASPAVSPALLVVLPHASDPATKTASAHHRHMPLTLRIRAV